MDLPGWDGDCMDGRYGRDTLHIVCGVELGVEDNSGIDVM